jgi:hypothetical protein
MLENKQKIYREKYRSDKRRKEIMFTKTEYQYIERKSKDYSRPVSEFLKECVFNYLNNRYMVHDPNLYRAILLEIRRIGTNINQITKIANTNKKINTAETMQLSRGVKEIESLVKNSLQNPPELLSELSKAIINPYFLYQVEVLIYNHKIKNDSKIAPMEKARL